MEYRHVSKDDSWHFAVVLSEDNVQSKHLVYSLLVWTLSCPLKKCHEKFYKFHQAFHIVPISLPLTIFVWNAFLLFFFWLFHLLFHGGPEFDDLLGDVLASAQVLAAPLYFFPFHFQLMKS